MSCVSLYVTPRGPSRQFSGETVQCGEVRETLLPLCQVSPIAANHPSCHMYYDFTMREKRMGRSMFGNASFWVRFTSSYFAANSTQTRTQLRFTT